VLEEGFSFEECCSDGFDASGLGLFSNLVIGAPVVVMTAQIAIPGTLI
jgi:hypothetical protein